MRPQKVLRPARERGALRGPGPAPRAPAVFGSYEVGRSRKQSNQHPNANFTSGSKKGLTVEEQGDPGSYDPYTHTDLVASSSFSHNKSHKPFGSTSGRKFGMNLYGADAPGPGAYDPEKPHPSTNPNNSIFRSGSSQRPNNKTRVPGAGTYSPNHKSVHANMRNAGASMRGTGDRFAEEPRSARVTRSAGLRRPPGRARRKASNLVSWLLVDHARLLLGRPSGPGVTRGRV